MLGYNIAVSVIGIMLSVGGIVYGLGISFDHKRMKEFGRDEVMQSLINGAILGSLILMFGVHGLLNSIVDGVVSSVNASASCSGTLGYNYALCFAHSYLMSIGTVSVGGVQYPSLLSIALGMLIAVSGIYVAIGIIASTTLSVGLASFTFSTLFNPLLTQQNYIISALTFSVISIYMQGVLINVIATIAMPLLIPLGMVLRSFYFTRRLGGAIMAIAIGLFAIFPLTYVLDAQITASYYGSMNQVMLQNAQGRVNEFGSQAGALGSANKSAASSIIGGVESLASSIFKYFENIVEEESYSISILVVEVIFFPVFSVILTIISIRELARILGTEVTFGRFGMI